jgi:hypothetical protein
MRTALAFMTMGLIALGCAAPGVEAPSGNMPASWTIGAPVTLSRADGALVGLRVRVDPDITSTRSFDGKMQESDIDKYEEAVREILQGTLVNAGYVVPRDGEPTDLTLHVTYHANTVFEGSGESLKVVSRAYNGFVTVKRGAEIVDRIDSPQQLEQANFAADIVNKLSGSNRVATLAQKINKNVSATASTTAAPAAPATPAPAAPQAPPAAAVVAAPAPPASPAVSVAASGYVVAAPQPSAYALIIGIEKYRDVPSPTGARGDAEKFAKLARQTLGVPESHIQVAVDDRASKGDIEKHLEWLKANAQPGSRIYFFFSGHGAPEPTTGTSYLLPYDGDPRYLDGTALRLQTVLARLQETKAREVLAVLDSCFSGAGGRSVLPPGARALVRVQAPPTAARIALFSASSGAQTSGPAPGSASEGLFTQKILQALGGGQGDLNGDGQVSLEELRDWVKPRVTRDAKSDNRDQTPELFLGNNIGAPSSFIVAWGLATK